MLKTDVICWYILSITGLKFLNKKLGHIAKCFKFLYTVGCSIAFSYYAIAIFCFIRIKLYKELMLYILLPINSGVMWFISYSKRKAISYIILKVYRRRKYYIAKEKSRYLIIFFLTFFGLFLPCLWCMYNQIVVNFKIFHLIFVTFGQKLQYGIWQRIFIFCIQLSTFVLKFSFPFHLGFCICLLFYRCSDILSSYNTFLRTHLYTSNKWDTCNYDEFFDLLNFLRQLNQTITMLSFYIILYSLEGMCYALFSVLSQDIFRLTIGQVIFLANYVVYNVNLLVCFTICCSMIPENIIEIRRTVKNFLNCSCNKHLISNENLFFLKRIENEDIVYISICGMFNLTRSYILSAFGIVLTYGLLVINLKF